tara:strand:- start:227 stop:2047 length:1821 start_codon:yes stop_codon:yes gene_type:complete
MNNMAKQMDMFDNGGLMDEGGTVDPVSGNDVPPGSNQEEVRDDIPAQLSEGEFVFPADVVRFIGLEKLMMIRQRAKAGLQRMDDMGQMGNSEEAIMPDDLPFSIDDLDMEDDGLEMAQGGVVQAANGTFVQPTPTNPNAGVFYNPASQPTTGVAAAPMQAASAGAAPSIGQAATPVQAASAGQPTMFTNYQLPQAPVPVMTPPDQLPKFLGETVPGVGGVDYTEETYVNEAGQTIKFRRYNDGSLKDSSGNEAVVPEGYTIKSEADKKVTTDPTKVQTATVQDDGDGGDNQDDTTTGTTMSFGGNLNNRGMVENNFRGNISYRGANYGKGPLGIKGLMDVPNLANRLRSSGLHQITGGKMGQPLSLMPGESVIIDNIVQSQPGVNMNKDLNVSFELDHTAYNDLISNQTVTSRAELDRIAKHVQEFYKDVKKSDRLTVDVDRRMRDQVKQIDQVREGLKDPSKEFITVTDRDSDGNTFNTEVSRDIAEKVSQGVDLEAAAWESGFTTEPDAPAPAPTGGPIGYEPGAGDGQSDNTGSDDTGGATGGGPSSGGSDPDDDGDSGFGGGGYDGGYGYGGGDYKGAFVGEAYKKNKLAKQMKRSGLASKK